MMIIVYLIELEESVAVECNKNYNCKCDQCGKYFHKKPSHINKTHNFCSQKCHYEFKKTSMKGKG